MTCSQLKTKDKLGVISFAIEEADQLENGL